MSKIEYVLSRRIMPRYKKGPCTMPNHSFVGGKQQPTSFWRVVVAFDAKLALLRMEQGKDVDDIEKELVQKAYQEQSAGEVVVHQVWTVCDMCLSQWVVTHMSDWASTRPHGMFMMTLALHPKASWAFVNHAVTGVPRILGPLYDGVYDECPLDSRELHMVFWDAKTKTLL